VPDSSIRLRPVRGRVVDPYRGTLDDGDPFELRDADTQPFDELALAIRAYPGVRVHVAGRRFRVTRGHDELRIGFASAGRRVSLDDAVLEGDAVLAIEIVFALLPLLGAVELRAGAFVEVIDGHEQVDAVILRYRTCWIDAALQLADQLRTALPPPRLELQPPRDWASLALDALRASRTPLVVVVAVILIAFLVAR